MALYGVLLGYRNHNGSCVLVLFVICQHELLFLKSLVIIQFQEIATFRQYN